MADTIITKVVGGVAAGIGLVSEGISAKRKQSAAKKLAAQNANAGEGSISRGNSRDAMRTPDLEKKTFKHSAESEDPEGSEDAPPTYEEAIEYDEEQWDLDDAQRDLKLPLPSPESPHSDNEPESSSAEQKTIRNVHKLTDAFMAKHPVPEYISHSEKLGVPVVLPQRRPKERHRGFIRAYAPVLGVKGIDEDAFLEFIETFDKASQASPWIQAINLANFATIPLAPPFSILVSIALQVAVDTTTEMHSRRRTNTFLDRANAEFFQPRGLFCLVMTWNAESDQRTDTIDITGTISNRVASQSNASKTQRIRDQFSSSNGNTYGDIEFPEVAPLVFPALDKLADETGKEAAGKREKLKKAKNFASDYFDRRAVAKYAGQNPDSVLAAQAGEKPTFTSRYADPNHPASNGNLISLITGGYINPQPQMRNMQQDRMMALEERRGRAWGGSGNMYGRDAYDGRDAYGRDAYGRDAHGRDAYGRDSYGRDMYGRAGFGGGLGGGFSRRRGFENSGVGMLIGALVDRGSRGQSSNQPAPPQQHQQHQHHQYDQDRQFQYSRNYAAPQEQPGTAPPPQPRAPYGSGLAPGYGPGYSRDRFDASNNPIAMLNPIMGIKRILKQRVLYLMIVDMPTKEQLSAASEQLNRA